MPESPNDTIQMEASTSQKKGQETVELTEESQAFIEQGKSISKHLKDKATSMRDGLAYNARSQLSSLVDEVSKLDEIFDEMQKVV